MVPNLAYTLMNLGGIVTWKSVVYKGVQNRFYCRQMKATCQVRTSLSVSISEG